MTYKDKHIYQTSVAFRKAFKTAALSAALLLTTGCENSPKISDNQLPKNGLMDSTSIKTFDKYNTAIVIDLVNVPVYDKNGNRKEGYSVLTRGIKNSSYTSANNKTFIRRAFLNDGNSASYVKVNEDNAIFTGNGNGDEHFSGLFIDDNNDVVLVADKNIDIFIKECRDNRISFQNKSNTNENKRFSYNNLKTDFQEIVTDSVIQNNVEADADSLTENIHIITEFHPIDTLKEQNLPEISDSVLNKKHYTRD